MQSKSRPKASFSSLTSDGDRLELAIWNAKIDPSEEVLAVKLDRFSGGRWDTVHRMAFRRTKDGNYEQLQKTTASFVERRPLTIFQAETKSKEDV